MMTDEPNADGGCTDFEFDPSNDDPADLWVDEVFRNSYGDQRACIDGDTYEAKEIIKSNWDRTHHDFDGDRKQWVVDVDSLDWLAEQLEAEGYATDFSPQEDRDEALYDAHEYVEEGDDITVTYEQKNRNGESEFSGEVVYVGYTEEGQTPEIRFRRHSDDHLMYVQYDKYGKVALYTSGSHAPFVGAATRLRVHTDEDRGTEDEQETSDEELGCPECGTFAHHPVVGRPSQEVDEANSLPDIIFECESCEANFDGYYALEDSEDDETAESESDGPEMDAEQLPWN
jgi:hypothetical protein